MSHPPPGEEPDRITESKIGGSTENAFLAVTGNGMHSDGSGWREREERGKRDVLAEFYKGISAVSAEFPALEAPPLMDWSSLQKGWHLAWVHNQQYDNVGSEATGKQDGANEAGRWKVGVGDRQMPFTETPFAPKSSVTATKSAATIVQPETVSVASTLASLDKDRVRERDAERRRASEREREQEQNRSKRSGWDALSFSALEFG